MEEYFPARSTPTVLMNYSSLLICLFILMPSYTLDLLIRSRSGCISCYCLHNFAWCSTSLIFLELGFTNYYTNIKFDYINEGFMKLKYDFIQHSFCFCPVFNPNR